jgi:transcriptional regulator GlxA family with amidase domain
MSQRNSLAGNSLVTQRVTIVVFEDAQMLDVAGPSDVFSLCNQFGFGALYEVQAVSAKGGLLRLSNGLRVDTKPSRLSPVHKIDTLIVAGGDREGLVAAMQDAALQRWVSRAAPQVRRLASVCSGAFVLAHWGLLDKLRATTHWSAAHTMRRHYPSVQVEPDSLFVQDGKVWTSGGVTSGIDMCLAMVEADHGRWLATQVARRLTLSVRRVGNQAQYSTDLESHAGRYAGLVQWIREHLLESLDVAKLASQAGESERTFNRRFVAETGSTPAAFVEKTRLQVAKLRLEGGASVKSAARSAGFTSDQHLARAFSRRLGMSPMEYGRAHRGSVESQKHARR